MTDWPLPDGYRASRECFERFGELSSYTLSLGDPAFSHQYAVDAYAAQHAGEVSSAIRVFFALVGLHLAFDRGFTGREVQRAHMLLARRKRDWPRFKAPVRMAELTVQDVLGAAPGKPRNAALREWAKSIWTAWGPEHERVRQLVAEWLR